MSRPRVLALRLAPWCVAAAVVAAQPAPPARSGCTAPEHRQFDFWLGEWEVEQEGAGRAGTNRIESILEGCALQERWTGASGMRGTSLNAYSPRDRKWHQTWVDTSGLRLDLEGGLRGGSMVLEGPAPGDKPGTTVLHRISWQKLADGSVRQHWQASSDGGAVWEDVFVGLYRKLAKAP
jgi:hypothetical protein